MEERTYSFTTYIATDLGYVDVEKKNEVMKQINIVAKLISGLRRSTLNKNDKPTPTPKP